CADPGKSPGKMPPRKSATVVRSPDGPPGVHPHALRQGASAGTFAKEQSMDSIPNHKHSGPPKQPGPVSIQSNPLRWGVGAVLFLAWVIATIIWVASTV